MMKVARHLFLFALLSVIVVSCTKDKKLGKDVIDSDSYLFGSTTDTFDLVTYTIAEDSVITDNASNVVLGSYVDPKFGKVTASFYTQFRLAGFDPNFGEDAIQIDSFVLALKYAGYYGSLTAQTFEVYEMNDSISLDSTYYSFSNVAVKSTNLVPVGKGTIVPDPLNNAIVGGDTIDAQLRIHLDTNLARIMINEAKSGNGTFSSNEDFLAYFKGIKVVTNNGNQSVGQGAILYFDITNSASKATIYYHQSNLQKDYDLLINSNSADFSHVDIENAGTPVAALVQDSTLGNVEFYAQAFKHRAAVKIKDLDKLPKKIIIHRADLQLPVQFQTGYRFKPGSSVSVATKLKSTDNAYTSLGILGDFDETAKHYKVDLRTYVQAVINNDIENNGIVISPRYFINSAERIVFNGKNTTNKKKPKLILTYTTY